MVVYATIVSDLYEQPLGSEFIALKVAIRLRGLKIIKSSVDDLQRRKEENQSAYCRGILLIVGSGRGEPLLVLAKHFKESPDHHTPTIKLGLY